LALAASFGAFGNLPSGEIGFFDESKARKFLTLITLIELMKSRSDAVFSEMFGIRPDLEISENQLVRMDKN